MNPITLFVEGKPIQQGSKSARVVNGKAILTEGFGKKPQEHKKWRETIRKALPVLEEPVDEPVFVQLDFYFERPKSVKREYMTVAPDIDKLCRSVLDSLTWKDGLGILQDDSRVVQCLLSKQYGEKPGVEIHVASIE